MERKEVFDGIMQFIPQGFHNSVKESTDYLKRLHGGVKRVINLTRCTLEVSPKGVEYI